MSEKLTVGNIIQMTLAEAKKYSFLAPTQTPGVFIGITFVGDDSSVLPDISVVRGSYGNYSRVNLDEMKNDYTILKRYVTVGEFFHLAIMQEISWDEMVEAIESVVGEVTFV
mgnify:CR=1 FL=1